MSKSSSEYLRRREREGDLTAERSHVMSKAASGAMHSEDGGRDREPGDAGSSRNSKGRGNQSLPQSLQRDEALLTA